MQRRRFRKYFDSNDERKSDFFCFITCGKDGLFWEGLIVDDGELGQLDVLHSSHRAAVAAALPVELNVVCGVAIWRGLEDSKEKQLRLPQSFFFLNVKMSKWEKDQKMNHHHHEDR